jgi:4-hydroxy-tetrahydrodipicolinate synthase
MRLTGAITALITPFRRDGDLDIAALENLVEAQIAAGIGGLAVCTVTGEGSALSFEEREAVISTTVRKAAGRVPVIASTGTNSTESTIALTCRAEALGAAAALVTVPYYSKPGQKGILHHFREVAAASRLPLIVVDDPVRTASTLSAATLEELSRNAAIFGILQTAGDMAPLECFRDRLHLFTGNELTAPAFLACGGDALISPVSNVLPRLVTALQHAASCGNLPAALLLCDRLTPLVEALGMGDPARIKHAVNALTGTPAELRLPLVPADDDERETIAAALVPFTTACSRHLSL